MVKLILLPESVSGIGIGVCALADIANAQNNTMFETIDFIV
jgi:hypothetical protein